MKSVKEIVEDAIRAEYQRQFDDVATELIAEFTKEFESKLQSLHERAKKEAHIMTLEMLHKIDKNGLSVEFKI